MNSYEVNRLLEEARRIQPQQLSYQTEWKMCQVLIDGPLEYEHKTYSNHRYEKGVGPDVVRMAPSHAKEFWVKGAVSVVRGGACDCFKFPGGLLGYRPWTTAPDPAVRDGHENVWVRCRLTKFISLINGLEPAKLLEGDVYLQWHFLRGCGVSISLENEFPPGAIEVRVPQVELASK